MVFYLISLLLFSNWLLFSGKFDALHIGMGVGCSLLVAWFSGSLLFKDRSKSASQRIHEFLTLPVYILWLLKEIFVANVNMLKLVLSPTMMDQIQPRMFGFRADEIENEFGRYVLANSITLTPGTVTVRLNGDIVTVHALTERDAEGLPQPMMSKVAHVFNSEGR